MSQKLIQSKYIYHRFGFILIPRTHPIAIKDITPNPLPSCEYVTPPIFNKNVIILFLCSVYGANLVLNGYILKAFVSQILFGLLKLKNPDFP